jgi:Bacteriophage HK97-gp10, putative tail-component
MALGGVRVKSRLDEAARRVDEEVEEDLRAAASKGEAKAKALTPVRTGAARASIRASASGAKVELTLGTRSAFFSDRGGRGQKPHKMLWTGGQTVVGEMKRTKLDLL